MADERLASGHVNPEEHAVAAQAHISAGTMAAKVPGPVGQAVAREHAKHAERHIDVAERLKRGERPEKVIRYNIRYTGWGKSEPLPDEAKRIGGFRGIFDPAKHPRDLLGRFRREATELSEHAMEASLQAFSGEGSHEYAARAHGAASAAHRRLADALNKTPSRQREADYHYAMQHAHALHRSDHRHQMRKALAGAKFWNPLKQGRDRFGRFAGGPPGSAIAAHVIEGEVLRAFAGSERHRREEPDISPPGPGPALPPARSAAETARRLRAQRGLAPLGVRERSRMLVPTHETGQFVVWHDRDVDYAEARHAARAADRGVRSGTVAAETAAQAHEVAAAHAAAVGRDSLARRHHTRAVQHRTAQLAIRETTSPEQERMSRLFEHVTATALGLSTGPSTRAHTLRTLSPRERVGKRVRLRGRGAATGLVVADRGGHRVAVRWDGQDALSPPTEYAATQLDLADTP